MCISVLTDLTPQRITPSTVRCRGLTGLANTSYAQRICHKLGITTRIAPSHPTNTHGNETHTFALEGR